MVNVKKILGLVMCLPYLLLYHEQQKVNT